MNTIVEVVQAVLKHRRLTARREEELKAAREERMLAVVNSIYTSVLKLRDLLRAERATEEYERRAQAAENEKSERKTRDNQKTATRN